MQHHQLYHLLYIRLELELPNWMWFYYPMSWSGGTTRQLYDWFWQWPQQPLAGAYYANLDVAFIRHSLF